MRVYLAGSFAIETDELLITERQLPGRQGLLAASFLVAHRAHPVARESLEQVIWGEGPGVDKESALNAIISKLRSLFRPAGIAIENPMGRYRMVLPPDAWVDLEASRNALDEAEGALRSSDPAQAFGPANVVVAIAGRGFLEGIDVPWAVHERDQQREQLVRALDCLAELSQQNDELTLAVHHAARAVLASPFREVGYQRLMRLHYLAGNRGEALRVYEDCRRLIAEELGVDPSPSTQEVYLQVLQDTGAFERP
jgi:SARP family transcriptional regulator, regulator of embCAB operon